MAETKVFGITINTDSLTKIPESYKIAGGVVLSLAVLAGGIYYLFMPVYEEYSKLNGENQELATKNKADETKLGYVEATKRYTSIDKIVEEKAKITKKIDRLKERIPSKANISPLIYDLERFVESNNKSDLYDVIPSNPSKVTLPPDLSVAIPPPAGVTAPPGSTLELNQIVLNLNIDSNYPNLINLLKDFERYQRAIGATSLSLTPVDKTKKFNVLKTTLNMRAYILPEGAQ
ncbi:MAG: hypothetical protein U0457_00405 [Candidatus Sericytochromatia bacterium]